MWANVKVADHVGWLVLFEFAIKLRWLKKALAYTFAAPPWWYKYIEICLERKKERKRGLLPSDRGETVVRVWGEKRTLAPPARSESKALGQLYVMCCSCTKKEWERERGAWLFSGWAECGVVRWGERLYATEARQEPYRNPKCLPLFSLSFFFFLLFDCFWASLERE